MKTDHVIALIAGVRDAAHSLILRELARNGVHDLAPSHGAIMDELYRHSSLRMNDLARLIRRDKSTVTALVDKLVELGYVKRRTSRRDRRATEVALTTRGRNLRPVFDRVSTVLLSRTLAGIPQARAEYLVADLEAMLGNLRVYSTERQHLSSESLNVQRRTL